VRPPSKRRAKFKNNSKKGIFLGFVPHTTRNILWYDVDTERVKIASHVRFDEGMNDLPIDRIPPNVQHLERVQQGHPIPAETEEVDTSSDLHFYIHPFSKLISKKLKSSYTDPAFGMVLATDELNQRVYIKSIAAKKSASKLFSRLWHVDGEHELVDVVVLYYYDVDDDSLVKETWSSWTTVQ